MVMRIYALAWLLLAAVGGLFLFTGNLNEVTFTVLAFPLATLAFMGIVVVLPWWMDRHFSWKY
jgi:hypothetical protein